MIPILRACAAAVTLTVLHAALGAAQPHPYRDPVLPVDARVKGVMIGSSSKDIRLRGEIVVR